MTEYKTLAERKLAAEKSIWVETIEFREPMLELIAEIEMLWDRAAILRAENEKLRKAVEAFEFLIDERLKQTFSDNSPVLITKEYLEQAHESAMNRLKNEIEDHNSKVRESLEGR